MANTEEITVLLKARDKELQSVIDRNTRLIGKFAREAKKDTSSAQRAVDGNMQKMKASFATFAKGAVAGLGVGLIVGALRGLTGSLRSTVSQIAAIGDEARRSGVDTTAFQEWKFVAEQNRIGIDQMTDGLKELNLRADEFIFTGAGPAAEAFGRMGYSAEDLAEKIKDPSDLMLELIDRMGRLDTAARIRVADEVFGGSAGERFVELIDQGSAGLQGTIEKGREVGAVLDEELIQKAAEIDRKFGEITTRMSNAFQASVVNGAAVLENLTSQKNALEDIVSLKEEAQLFPNNPLPDDVRTAPTDADLDAVRSIKDGYDEISDVLKSLALQLETMPRQLMVEGHEDDARMISEIAMEIDDLRRAYDAGGVSAEDFGEKVRELAADAEIAVGEVAAIDGVDMASITTRIQVLRGMVSGLAIAARAAVEAFNPQYQSSGRGDGAAEVAARRDAWRDTHTGPGTSPRPRSAPTTPDFGMPAIPKAPAGGGGGGGAGSTPADPFGDAMKSTAEDIKLLEMEAAALVAVAAAGMEYGQAVDYARKRADLMFEAQQAGKEITPELQAEIDKLAGSYVAAGDAADQAADDLRAVEDNAKRGTDALSDLFVSIMDGSKSAEDALGDLLIQMAAVQFRQAAMSGLDGAGGVAGFVGSLLGGARARGGPGQAGVPYLVNEDTPNSEIFVPSRSGAVLNVPQAQAALRDQAGGGSSPAQSLAVNVTVSGARGNAEITDMVEQGVRRGIGQFDRMVLPRRVGQINSDPRKIS